MAPYSMSAVSLQRPQHKLNELQICNLHFLKVLLMTISR